MNDLIFDNLSFGDHFENEDGKKFIKLRGLLSFKDEYYNWNNKNAVDYNGMPYYIAFDTKVKVVKLPNDKTELGYSFKVENNLLWKFVELVANSCNCQCGDAPFIDKNCPACFAKQFRQNKVSPQENEEIEKVVDSIVPSDTVVVSSANVTDDTLKNKHIETTKQMKTFNTLTEAIVEAINELKSAGTLSLHQISTLIRQKTNDSLWEVLDCVARPNGQNIKFWINHDDVRRIVNDMYANQQLDALGFTGRQFNGTYMEYNFDTNPSTFVASASPSGANVSTQPGPVLTASVAVSGYAGPAVAKTDAYVKSQIASGNRPTLKAVQSAVKTPGITCGDFKTIVESLGYKVTPGVTDCFSTYIVG